MEALEGQLREFLLDAGLLSRAQLQAALGQAEGRRLSDVLIEKGFLSEDEVRRAASHVLGVPYIVLARESVDPEALSLIPEPLCRSRGLVAYGVNERGVEVALLDLADLEALDFLRERTRVLPRLTSRDSLRQALFIYQSKLKEKFDANAAALLSHAASQGASTIHLEPAPEGARVRYRLGGVLFDAMTLSKTSGERLAAEFKELGGFSKTSPSLERRVRISTPEPLSLRLSLVPVVGGEKLVIHLLKESDRKGFTLESLGFHGAALELLQHVLHRKTGLIEVSGPSGSGVSTVLYTLLDILTHPARSLASVERAVEHRLPHVAQTQVNEATGLSSSAALRAVLKSDPDVVMLNDAEDETALQLVSQAARRCLVLLGCRDASVEADLAIQLRLARRLCVFCREEHRLTRAESHIFEERADFAKVLSALKEEGFLEKQTAWKEVKFFRAEGCSKCESGYRGRVGIQEVRAGDEMPLSLTEDVLFKAISGETSIEEALAVAGEETK